MWGWQGLDRVVVGVRVCDGGWVAETGVLQHRLQQTGAAAETSAPLPKRSTVVMGGTAAAAANPPC